jgi:hypothetical protein
LVVDRSRNRVDFDNVAIAQQRNRPATAPKVAGIYSATQPQNFRGQ